MIKKQKKDPERKKELLGGPTAAGDRSDHTSRRPLPSWQLRTGLGNSPAQGLRQGLTDTSTVLRRVLEPGPRSHAGQPIPSSPHAPQPPLYPVPTPSPPLAFCVSPSFLTSGTFCQRKLGDAHKPASRGGSRPGMLEGGHQAVCEPASRGL